MTDGCCPRYLLLDRQVTLLVCLRSHWSGGRELHPVPRRHRPVPRSLGRAPDGNGRTKREARRWRSPESATRTQGERRGCPPGGRRCEQRRDWLALSALGPAGSACGGPVALLRFRTRVISVPDRVPDF